MRSCRRMQASLSTQHSSIFRHTSPRDIGRIVGADFQFQRVGLAAGQLAMTGAKVIANADDASTPDDIILRLGRHDAALFLARRCPTDNSQLRHVIAGRHLFSAS